VDDPARGIAPTANVIDLSTTDTNIDKPAFNQQAGCFQMVQMISEISYFLPRPFAASAGNRTGRPVAARRWAGAIGLLALLGFSPVAWAESAGCGGKNLLEQLKTENREDYEKLIAEGEKIPNGKGVFWKIEKDGIEPSYLLGTMHLSDPRILDLPDSVYDAQYDAKVVIVEASEILDLKKAMGQLLMRPELTMLPDGKRIEDFLTKDEAKTLADGLRARGMVFSAVNRMRPWMISTTLATPVCETARRAKGARFLDQQIALDAFDEDIPVEGLETLDEQLNAMNSISTENHVKSLLQAVALGDQIKDITETMVQLYEAGEMGLLWQLLFKRYAVDPSAMASGMSEFENAMLTKRNHVMAERSTRFLSAGNAFVAVGALHLQGEEGLVELFRKQGYTVTRAE
jgi:uncharacterized protein YbaP (TraB family)